jgi:hypothetical protein
MRPILQAVVPPPSKHAWLGQRLVPDQIRYPAHSAAFSSSDHCTAPTGSPEDTPLGEGADVSQIASTLWYSICRDGSRDLTRRHQRGKCSNLRTTETAAENHAEETNSRVGQRCPAFGVRVSSNDNKILRCPCAKSCYEPDCGTTLKSLIYTNEEKS